MIERASDTLGSAPAYRVRRATWEDDREALCEVRFSVFVDEQQIPRDVEIDAQDPTCEHVLATDSEGHPIGTARLCPDGHIGRVAVLAHWRRHRVGTALMQSLIDRARRRSFGRIELSSQLSALPFYEALGFVARGPTYLEAGIDHRAMELDLTRCSA